MAQENKPTLNYIQFGEGCSSLVFLHGFLESHKMWLEYAKALKKDYNIVLIDFPGHGNSQTLQEDLTISSLAKQVQQILMDLKIEKSIFIGHSMGGYVALAFAELFPKKVQSVVLFFSTSLADSAQKKELRERAILTAKKSFKNFIRLSIPKLFNQTKIKDLKEEIQLAKTWAQETSLNGAIACLQAMKDRKDRTFLLHNLAIDYLVIYGTYDEVVDNNAFLSAIPKQRNIKIQQVNAAHMGHLEAKKECYDLIKDHLNFLTLN